MQDVRLGAFRNQARSCPGSSESSGLSDYDDFVTVKVRSGNTLQVSRADTSGQ